MSWRVSQTESRTRYLAKCDETEAKRYDSWIQQLTPEDDAVYLADIRQVFLFREGMHVLDVGAGTGAMCRTLMKVSDLNLTALDPSPQMLARFRARSELRDVSTVEGFCDSADDRDHFDESTFDVIISRQLVNNLFDPLAAFENWHHWLKPGGSVIVIDGLYRRESWVDKWEEEIDQLPASACQTTALVPYLLEKSGLDVNSAGLMTATNEMPNTRTPRYIVVASRIAN